MPDYTRLDRLATSGGPLLLTVLPLFYADGKAMDQPRVDSSPNPEFIRLKAILHLVKFVDVLFPEYKQKKGWAPKDTFSSLY